MSREPKRLCPNCDGPMPGSLACKGCMARLSSSAKELDGADVSKDSDDRIRYSDEPIAALKEACEAAGERLLELGECGEVGGVDLAVGPDVTAEARFEMTEDGPALMGVEWSENMVILDDPWDDTQVMSADEREQLRASVDEWIRVLGRRRLDLDRLHRVVLDGGGRRAGHTFASCHEVAGTIQVGATAVLVMLPAMMWVEHVLPMLRDVLRYHGLGELRRSTVSPREWVAGDVRIRFGSMQQWERETAGWRGHAVVIDR